MKVTELRAAVKYVIMPCLETSENEISESVLRNHAPAIIDLIAAVTAWRDLRYSHLRAVIMGSAPDTEDAHRERLLRQSAAAERIESALDKLESIP